MNDEPVLLVDVRGGSGSRGRSDRRVASGAGGGGAAATGAVRQPIASDATAPAELKSRARRERTGETKTVGFYHCYPR